MTIRGLNVTWTLVLASLGSAASGQSEGAPWMFNGGYTLGATAAQVRGDGIEGFNKMGFHAGALVEVRQYRDLGFQIGILYNQKGSRKVQNPKVDDYTNWGYKFTYVDVPIAAVYDFQDGFTFGTGLQPGVLIGAYEDGLASGVSDGVWEPTTLPIRSWELSWVVWVGMRSGETGEWFLRHTQSLPGIVPKPDVVNPNVRWDDRMQNMTMQVGYTKLLRAWSDR
jgi:hypothetical protein